MFVYYYIHVDRPFIQAESHLLRMLPGLRGWANDAYREGEHLYTRMGTRTGMVAKNVELTLGTPARGPNETWIPLEWEATGVPGIFPRMQADIVVASIGPALTQIAFRGTYRVPLGKVGEAIDRAFLHRLAEASVKSFLDRIAAGLEEDLKPTEGSIR